MLIHRLLNPRGRSSCGPFPSSSAFLFRHQVNSVLYRSSSIRMRQGGSFALLHTPHPVFGFLQLADFFLSHVPALLLALPHVVLFLFFFFFLPFESWDRSNFPLPPLIYLFCAELPRPEALYLAFAASG